VSVQLQAVFVPATRMVASSFIFLVSFLVVFRLSPIQPSLPSVVFSMAQWGAVLSCFESGLGGGVAHFFGFDAFAD